MTSNRICLSPSEVFHCRPNSFLPVEALSQAAFPLPSISGHPAAYGAPGPGKQVRAAVKTQAEAAAMPDP